MSNLYDLIGRNKDYFTLLYFTLVLHPFASNLFCFLFRFAWFRFRLISFRILKFLFRFEAKQAKLGGQFRYFAKKKFCYVSLQFRFEAKFGDTLFAPLEVIAPSV